METLLVAYSEVDKETHAYLRRLKETENIEDFKYKMGLEEF